MKNAVPEGGMGSLREQSLIRLIDDESPVVQAAVRDELKRQGERGIAFLKRLSQRPNRILASHARQFLEELEGPEPVASFIQFIRSLQFELETGCLLLNRTVYPELDTSECCMILDAIGARCRELMVLPSTPWEKCKVLNRVIFHEYGFRGNVENYDDPLNSFIGHVLRRRKGLPITLCIVYILAAQRCGLDLEPVGMPYHFLVGCFLEKMPFYIDAFERGRFRTTEELKAFLERRNIEPLTEYLAPASVSDVLRRCCQNLVDDYRLEGNPERAQLFERFVHEFEGRYRRHANP